VLNARKNSENRCYKQGVESVCINLLGFLFIGKIVTGRRFRVSVDHRA
jgi:hypothetical protein